MRNSVIRLRLSLKKHKNRGYRTLETSPIEINHLTFRYRSREENALEDICLKVEKGQIVLIAGTSGCGKTTLARCINGLIPRSYKGDMSGEIRLMGQSIEKMTLANISQMIGTVLQDPERQILGSLVKNEVAFGLENLAYPREQIIQGVQESLERLNIAYLADRDTFSLSGGEKQKIALAGVLAMKPGILLLDEPLASLDPASAQETLQIVRSLADEGLTVLMVEHRVEDVLKINPDRILYLDKGKIVYDGPIESITDVVDYREVKLPAPIVMRKARADAPLPKLQSLVEQKRDAQAAALVQFKDVAFGYDKETLVLHSINLSIHKGDIIALLGANGAGKTTMVKHAIGLLKPVSGKVLVEGRDTKDLSVAEIAKTLGYVFQSPSHMLFAPTVRDELSFGPINLKHNPQDIEKSVVESLEIVNLSEMIDTPPLAMSFGQQKRISIAAILAMHSKILVMDEPTAGQDYKNYTDFMNAIIQLPNFDAILFITHDIDLAQIYANRVLLFNNGQIVRDGTPHEVMKDYQRLEDCRLVASTLLDENIRLFPQTGKFLRAEQLAHL
jgi:energy-coupling factor transport system ATP-binding protein